MSVVVGKVLESGKIQLASDSITVRGYTQRKNGSSHSKLWRTDQDMVVGSVGVCAESAMLQQFLTSHKLAGPEVGAVLGMFQDFAVWQKGVTDKYEVTNGYLVGFEGHLFGFSGWFVDEVTTFEAIGAGADFALAALHLGHDVAKAVEVAIELSVFCEPPILFELL